MESSRIELCQVFTKFNYTCDVQKIAKIFVLLTVERVIEVCSERVAGRRLRYNAVHAAWLVPIMLRNVNKASRCTSCVLHVFLHLQIY